jgi:hypothetical protein
LKASQKGGQKQPLYRLNIYTRTNGESYRVLALCTAPPSAKRSVLVFQFLDISLLSASFLPYQRELYNFFDFFSVTFVQTN